MKWSRMSSGDARAGSMKNKLVIVTDLGLFRACRTELTPKHTPRLELIEEFMFVEAHRRFDEMLTDMAGRHVGAAHRVCHSSDSSDGPRTTFVCGGSFRRHFVNRSTLISRDSLTRENGTALAMYGNGGLVSKGLRLEEG